MVKALRLGKDSGKPRARRPGPHLSSNLSCFLCFFMEPLGATEATLIHKQLVSSLKLVHGFSIFFDAAQLSMPSRPFGDHSNRLRTHELKNNCCLGGIGKLHLKETNKSHNIARPMPWWMMVCDGCLRQFSKCNPPSSGISRDASHRKGMFLTHCKLNSSAQSCQPEAFLNSVEPRKQS